LTETREALEQQTATAEVLQVINSSPGDLAPVFEAMLEKAIRLCGGVTGILWTIDSDRGRVAAARGLPEEFLALLRERGASGTHPFVLRVARGERLIEFPDMSDTEYFHSDDPIAKGAVVGCTKLDLGCAGQRRLAHRGGLFDRPARHRPFL
jgi:hypothetical protein